MLGGEEDVRFVGGKILIKTVDVGGFKGYSIFVLACSSYQIDWNPAAAHASIVCGPKMSQKSMQTRAFTSKSQKKKTKKH